MQDIAIGSIVILYPVRAVIKDADVIEPVAPRPAIQQIMPKAADEDIVAIKADQKRI